MGVRRERRTADTSDSEDITEDDSVSGDAWTTRYDSGGGSVHVMTTRSDVAVDYSIASSSHASSAQSGVSRPANTPRRHTGPRKRRVSEKLTPEEEERRRMRRERNKFAAAKCRQKRVDLTNQLLAETEKLESEQAKLQDDIKAFQREKDELEFILDAHRLHCGIGQSTSTTAAAAAVTMTTTDSEAKVQPSESKIVVVVAGTLPGSAHSATDSSQLSAGSTQLTTGSAPLTTTVTVKSEEKGIAARRPNSLVTPTVTVSGSQVIGSQVTGSQVIGSQVTGSQVAGVSITTPSAGINVYTLGLESMLDGHTGLTPITGLPVSLAGLSMPIFAIPATVAGISVEETTSTEAAATSTATSSAV